MAWVGSLGCGPLLLLICGLEETEIEVIALLSQLARCNSQYGNASLVGLLLWRTLTLRSRHSSQTPSLRIKAALAFVCFCSGPWRPDLSFLGWSWSPATASSWTPLEMEWVVLA